MTIGFWLLLFAYDVGYLVSGLSISKAPRVFIGGLGYCGSRIATSIRQEFPNAFIAGTVRSDERRRQLVEDRNKVWDEVFVLDLDQDYAGLSPEGIDCLKQSTTVIQTVAPIADFDRDPLLALHGDILKNSGALEWVGYLSSTGVYGDHDGAWVDETSELRCTDAKSLARVTAESEWRALETDQRRIECFRCGGIYGPNRGPLFSASCDLAVPPPPSGTPKFINRILVDDICGALISAMKGSRPVSNGRVYNLVDDDPAPRRDVIIEARRVRGLLESEGSSSSAPSKRLRSRNTGNKQCRNDRLKDEYNWMPNAPTYREGLALLMEQNAF